MEETVGRVTPRTLFPLVLRQQAVFEEGGETEILLSSGAYMEWESSEFL